MESCSDIYALPEDCIANALSLTSPMDACRLSAVAPTFRSAAQSDAVWVRFLPSDYLQMISRSADSPDSLLNKFHSKKDLYLYLCDNPILIDGGLKSFWLEKRCGKKCYMLAARDLFIVWGDTPQYWQWVSLPESRFAEVAELLDVCWLEIRGKINVSMLSPATKYTAYLVYTPKSTLHGFDFQPVEASVCLTGQEGKKSTVSLEQPERRRQRYRMSLSPARIGWFYGPAQGNPPAETQSNNPKKRDDGWMEVELGEILVMGGEEGDLEMSLLEVKGGNWKSGLIIQGIEIRPKESC